MTGYLLDTNVVSEIRKTKPHGAVLAWLQGLRDDQIHISALTLGELQRSIERARKQDKTKALEIESWVDQLQATHNVLPMMPPASAKPPALWKANPNIYSKTP